MSDNQIPEIETTLPGQHDRETDNAVRRRGPLAERGPGLDTAVYATVTIVSLVVLLALLAKMLPNRTAASSPPATGAAPAVVASSPASSTASPTASPAPQSSNTPAPIGLTPSPGPAQPAAMAGGALPPGQDHPMATPVPGTPSPAPARPAQPAATSAPTSGDNRAASVLEKVVKAETGLKSGEFEAVIRYSGTNQSSTIIQFDFGSLTRPAGIHTVSKYERGSNVQTVERISIGSRSWQRQLGRGWTAGSESEGAWVQIQTFLPRAGQASQTESKSDGALEVLQWYDPDLDADITLTVDPASGIPKEMRQLTRSTGSTLTVTYWSWNSPVEILAPQ